MSGAVTDARWRAAQQAESEFWHSVPRNPRTVGRIVASSATLAAWAAPHLPPPGDDAPWVEVGIGPLGVGAAHFLPWAGDREIVGVDPLDLIPLEELALPAPLAAAVAACREPGYRHVVAMGEHTGLDGRAFGLAILGNMLDHVQDPLAVLSEARRLLGAGEHLVMSCDVFSKAGRLKFSLYTRRRKADSILVRAHPFRFTIDSLEALVREAGFEIVALSGGRGTRERLVGGVQLVYLVARASSSR